MPPANIIVFTDKMVTSTVGVQTSCPTTLAAPCVDLYGDKKFDDNDGDCNYNDICPSHFTDIHRTKLEDTFSRKQKPDDIQLQIIAMECNLLYKDVRDWFKARRIKWIEELVRDESMTTKNTHFSNHNSIHSHKLSNETNSVNTNNTGKNIKHDTNNNKMSGPTPGTTSVNNNINGLTTSSMKKLQNSHLYSKHNNNNNIEKIHPSKRSVTNMVAEQSINDIQT